MGDTHETSVWLKIKPSWTRISSYLPKRRVQSIHVTGMTKSRPKRAAADEVLFKVTVRANSDLWKELEDEVLIELEPDPANDGGIEAKVTQGHRPKRGSVSD